MLAMGPMMPVLPRNHIFEGYYYPIIYIKMHLDVFSSVHLTKTSLICFDCAGACGF